MHSDANESDRFLMQDISRRFINIEKHITLLSSVMSSFPWANDRLIRSN